MDTKTKILIQEIKHWRNNKVLPEQYCDFLLAIYTEGSEFSPNNKSKKKIAVPLVRLCLAVLAVTTLLVYYFSDFSKQMQISLTIFLYVLCGTIFTLGLWFRHFSLQCLSMLILIITIGWSTLRFFEQYTTIFIQESGWIIIALLIIGAAWIIRNVNPTLCVSLYVNGIVLLFTPTFQALFMTGMDIKLIRLFF